MDPNATLNDLREALADWKTTSSMDEPARMDAGQRAVDAASALDDWLSRGGFLPTVWAVAK